MLKRRIGPTAGTGSAATLYTVPTNKRAALRHVHVANTTTTVQTFKMSIGADAVGTRLFSDTPVPTGGVLDWDTDVQLESAETLQWTGSTSLTVTATVEENL